MSHTKIKLAFFCYNDVLGLLALMVRNLLISCSSLLCGSRSIYIISLYSMKRLSEDSPPFIWICPSFESGCWCCQLTHTVVEKTQSEHCQDAWRSREQLLRVSGY